MFQEGTCAEVIPNISADSLTKYSTSSSPHLFVIWASRAFSDEKASSRSNSSNCGLGSSLKFKYKLPKDGDHCNSHAVKKLPTAQWGKVACSLLHAVQAGIFKSQMSKSEVQIGGSTM